MGIHIANIFFPQDLLLAILGFVLYLTAGCLIIHTWKDVPKETDKDKVNYRQKGLGLGCVLIMQSFVMLAEAGLQALRGKMVQVVN